MGCVRSCGLKDTDRVLVVLGPSSGTRSSAMYASLRHAHEQTSTRAAFLPLGVAHERVADDGVPGVEPVATSPAYRAHPLGHDLSLRGEAPMLWWPRTTPRWCVRWLSLGGLAHHQGVRQQRRHNPGPAGALQRLSQVLPPTFGVATAGRSGASAQFPPLWKRTQASSHNTMARMKKARRPSPRGHVGTVPDLS